MKRLLAIYFSIGIVGLIQSLIIPLLALLLERRGVSAFVNGISTTAIFLGVIIASPFIEPMVRRVGAQRTVIYSTWLCILMVVAFPIFDHLYAWILIRLILGIGLAGLFVATEIWLNRILTADNRGRGFAFYGLAIALGMAIGPLGINLTEISPDLPFYICAALFLIPLIITARVSSEDSELPPAEHEQGSGAKRWWRIFKWAPFAMCASLVYGYLDGALVGDFPIYGSRIGLSDSVISLTLTTFVVGSMIFQFPLGYLSDRWGRRPALMLASLLGMGGFLLLPFVSNNQYALLTVFFLAGGALGSFYSLGLAYLGDSLQPNDITTGNVLYTMNYGIGSLIGPSLTGLLISSFGQDAFAWSIAGMLFCYVVFGLIDTRLVKQQVSSFTHKGS